MPKTPRPLVIGVGGGVVGLILAAVFAVEGGYVNDPRDPGGETNHGITAKTARAHGYTGPMRDLTQEQAAAIYYQSYIVAPGFEPFVIIQPAIAHKLTDAGVNVGPLRASKWLQESLNSLSRGGQDYPLIKVDGSIGPQTLNAYLKLEKKRGRIEACQLVIKLIDGQQATYYMNLTHLNQYMIGWVHHRVGNVSPEWCVNYERVP